MSENLEYSIARLGDLLQSASSNASYAHELIFESVDSNLEQQIAVKQMSAIGFANAAYADLRSMQAITTADSDLERIEIDQAMSSMKNFVREMFKSISADHSHQWTDIYYQELLRAIYVLEGLFGVVAISETERKEYLD